MRPRRAESNGLVIALIYFPAFCMIIYIFQKPNLLIFCSLLCSLPPQLFPFFSQSRERIALSHGSTSQRLLPEWHRTSAQMQKLYSTHVHMPVPNQSKEKKKYAARCRRALRTRRRCTMMVRDGILRHIFVRSRSRDQQFGKHGSCIWHVHLGMCMSVLGNTYTPIYGDISGQTRLLPHVRICSRYFESYKCYRIVHH